MQHRLRNLHFRLIEDTLRSLSQQLHHGAGHLGGERHFATLPARHGAFVLFGAFHISRHVLHADELQDTACKGKAVAFFQARNKTLFNRADALTREILHLHRAIAHNRANAHAVAPANSTVGHAVDSALVLLDAVVIGVSRQALAAALAKCQRPVKLFAG